MISGTRRWESRRDASDDLAEIDSEVRRCRDGQNWWPPVEQHNVEKPF